MYSMYKMNTNNKERRTVMLSTRTYNRLKSMGTFQESFDQLIYRLMDIAEGKEKKEDKKLSKITDKMNTSLRVR